MRLLVATDAWAPQVNGVVRSLERMAEAAPAHGFEPFFVTPRDFRSLPMPGYPEIRLALAGARGIAAAWAR
ncbi:glycosyltransferase family 1 protein, partial [Methylobacterium sp. WL116]